MRWAQFYHLSTGWNGKDYSGPKKIIPACGSNGVYRLDTRRTRERSIDTAYSECKKRGYLGFKVYEGPRYDDSKPITDYKAVKHLDLEVFD